jgi:anaerobic magnesium-protoporphyrin IX monomethyl ester cyclase
MRVLLIFPSADKLNLAYAVKTFSPPLGVLYIAASLQEASIEVNVIDQTGEQMSDEQIVRRAERYSPDIVGISLMTWQALKSAKLASMIRERLPNVHVVFGGIHPTLNAERMMNKYSEIDSIIIGEGELAMISLVRALENNHDIASVPGIYYRSNGQVKQGAPRQFIDDLDSLPFPALNLVKREWYGHFAGFQWQDLAILITSRGCPYSCTFCSCSHFAGRRWRYRSPDNVVDEIEYMIGEGYRTFFFLDDCFTVNTKRVYQIADLIVKRGLDIDWSCEGRVDQVSVELTKAMVRSGCKILYLGIESASQKVLDSYKKRITPQMSMQAVNKARQGGMDAILGTFVLGGAGETEEDAKKTFEFAQKLDIDFPQFNVLRASPGIEIWDDLVTGGYINPEDYWETGVFVSEVHPDAIPLDRLNEMVAQGYDDFIYRSEYLLNELVRSLKSRYRLKLALKSLRYTGQIMSYIMEQSPWRRTGRNLFV